jgi:hypothetical protein
MGILQQNDRYSVDGLSKLDIGLCTPKNTMRIPTEYQIERETLERAIKEGIYALQKKNRQRNQHCAPLSVAVSQRLEEILGEERVSYLCAMIKRPVFKLVPALYAFLFPDRNPYELKFRDLLRQFPEVVKVNESFNGDVVEPVGAAIFDQDQIKRQYVKLLKSTIRALTVKTGESNIPLPTVGIWLKKSLPTFDLTNLDYKKLTDWVASLQEVKVHANGSISLAETPSAEPHSECETASVNKRRIAYLLIDGESVISNLFAILGSRPVGGKLPDYVQLLSYLNTHHSEFHWLARFFVAVQQGEAESSAELLSQLEYAGIQPFSFDVCGVEGRPIEETLEARTTVTRNAMAKVVNYHAVKNADPILAICSHDPGLAEPLTVIAQKASTPVMLCGFKKRMPVELLALESHGVRVVDLEVDLGIFKEPLTRTRTLRRIEDFEAADTL